MVTAQVSCATRPAVGFSETVVGQPVEAAGCAPLREQEIVNHGTVTVTGSLNVTEIFALNATPLAPADGTVPLTSGGWSLQFPSGEAELRGLGAPTPKSAALLSVSTQPLPGRSAAVVLLSVAVGPLPSKQFAAEP